MNEFFTDVFYDLSNLSFNKLKKLFNYCLEYADESHVQKLDRKELLRRQMHPSVSPIEYINNILNNNDHHVFIHRKGHIDQKEKDIPYSWCIEAGSCTLGQSPDYFLYIFIDEQHLDHIINKFQLKPL